MAYSSIFGGSSGGGGYSSVFGSGSSLGQERSPLEEMIAARTGRVPYESSESGILGFFGNLIGGVSDLSKGIGTLASSALHDVGQAIPGFDIGEGEYRLDDIAKAAAGFTEHGFDPLDEQSIIGDIWHRYSPLGPGGEPASKTFEAAYENPLSFILDAASVASGGAAGAAKGGAAVLKGTKAADIAASVTDDLARLGAVSTRAATRAGTRAGLESLAAEGALGPTMTAARHLLPSKTGKLLESGKLVPTTTALNPVYRALSVPVKRGLTRSVDDLAEEVGLLDTKIKDALSAGVEPLAKDVEEFNLKRDILTSATEAGVERIAIPQMARFNTYTQAGKVFAKMASQHLMNREASSAPFRDPLRRAIREDPTIADTFHITGTGLDIEIPELDPEGWAMRDQLSMDTANVAPRVEPGTVDIPDALTPDEAQLAQDADLPFYERTEAAADNIKSFMQRLDADREALEASGWDVDRQLEGARRLLAGVYDGLRRHTTNGAPDAPNVKRGTLAQDEIRLADIESRSPAWNSLADSPLHMLERDYFAMRMKYGGRFDGNEMVDAPDVFELDDTVRASGNAQPVYFPYIDANLLTKKDMFRSKALVGANRYAQDPHNKQLRGVLLREGSYVSDPVEAYTRRAARAVREHETWETMTTMLKQFGRRVSNAEEIPEGWVVAAPDALFMTHRTRMHTLDALDKARSEGMDKDAALVNAFEGVVVKNQDDYSRLVGDAVGKEGAPEMWAVPEVVAKKLSAASRWASIGGTNTRLFWDTPQQAWRALTLTGSPRWVVNNVIGNFVFAKMQGARTIDMMRSLGGRFKELIGEKMGLDLESKFLHELRQVEGYEDVGSGYVGTEVQGYVPKLGARAEATRTGRAITRARASTGKVARGTRGIGSFMKRLNSEIEGAFRDAGFLRATERVQSVGVLKRTGRSFYRSNKSVQDIAKNGWDEGKARLALDEVNQFMGDYSKLGAFERHVMRRFLFPFWGFYRHSAKLLLTYPIDYPGKALILAGLANTTEEMMAQYGPIPEWLQGSSPLGPPGANVSFLTSRGPNPFAGVFEDPTALLSPALKVGLEQSIGENLFTGEKFSDEGVITPYGSDTSYRIVTDENGNPIDAVPVEKVTPGIIEHFLQQVPQYDLIKEAIAGGKTYDTANIGSVLQGKGVIRDETTGEPVFPTGLAQQLQKFGGFPTINYDLGGYQEQLAEEQKIALMEAFERMGMTG